MSQHYLKPNTPIYSHAAPYVVLTYVGLILVWTPLIVLGDGTMRLVNLVPQLYFVISAK